MLLIPPGTAALLFDCDGTLADTMTLHYAAWRDTLLAHNIDCPRSFIDTHAGVPTHGIVAEINNLWGVSLDADAITADKEGRFATQIHLTKPVEEVLATAHAHFGKLPMAVVSGGTKEMVHAILETIDAIDLFPVIITASDPVAPKPAPDVFLEAARRLQVPANKCHVFEDGDPGIVSAQRAGMSFTDVRLVVKARAS
jgi:beta-phosphoglucomutase-like phosphatase (HAD superfamily)